MVSYLQAAGMHLTQSDLFCPLVMSKLWKAAVVICASSSYSRLNISARIWPIGLSGWFRHRDGKVITNYKTFLPLSAQRALAD